MRTTLFRVFSRRNRFPATARRTVYGVPRDNTTKWIGAAVVAGVAAYALNWATTSAQKESEEKQLKNTNWEDVRKDIAAIMDKSGYDDGSYGPVLVRLAWHAAGTYDKNNKTGGSDGATMRFAPEKDHGANAGLSVARNVLEQIQQKHPQLSTADIWILAGCVAIEHMNGPRIEFNPGRKDKPNGSCCPPDGRLPDAAQGASHVRDVFSRQGFNDQEIVALLGAHCLGRCHTDRSGYSGPWTASPTMFTNDFFVQLLERKWTKKKWNGPEQYEDETGSLMMLPSDIALRDDPEFRKWVEVYAKDEARFFKDFSKAFQKLLENGTSVCPVAHK